MNQTLINNASTNELIEALKKKDSKIYVGVLHKVDSYEMIEELNNFNSANILDDSTVIVDIEEFITNKEKITFDIELDEKIHQCYEDNIEEIQIWR